MKNVINIRPYVTEYQLVGVRLQGYWGCKTLASHKTGFIEQSFCHDSVHPFICASLFIKRQRLLRGKKETLCNVIKFAESIFLFIQMMTHSVGFFVLLTKKAVDYF